MLVCKVKRQLIEERARLQTPRAMPAHQSCSLPWGPMFPQLTLLSAHPSLSPAATITSLCWQFHAILLHQPGNYWGRFASHSTPSHSLYLLA